MAGKVRGGLTDTVGRVRGGFPDCMVRDWDRRAGLDQARGRAQLRAALGRKKTPAGAGTLK